MAYGKSFLPDSFKAQFVQKYISAIKGKEKRSEGHLEYRFPGKLRLEMISGSKFLYVTNSKKTWFYRPPFIEGEPGELRIGNKGDRILSYFFDGLKKGLKSNKLYSVMKKGKMYSLKFSKEEVKKTNVKAANLYFSGESQFINLEKLEITRNDGKVLTYQLSKIEPNVSIKNARFHFEAPKNTRTIGVKIN